jgi:hypothetical protein
MVSIGIGHSAAAFRRPSFATATLTAFLILMVTLHLLPTGEGPVQDTISMYALGPYGLVLRLALTCLGAGSFAVAVKFWCSIGGRRGRLLCGLTCVWATGSVLDACIDPSPSDERTEHGDVHVHIAVVAFAALVVAAIVFGQWLSGQADHGVQAAITTTLCVLAADAAQVVVTTGEFIAWDGVAERLVFTSAVCWMLVAVRVAERSRDRASTSVVDRRRLPRHRDLEVHSPSRAASGVGLQVRR